MMTQDEFFSLPELPPEKPPIGGSLGCTVLKTEGEYVLESWESCDGRDWWTETVDNVRYRRRWGDV